MYVALKGTCFQETEHQESNKNLFKDTKLLVVHLLRRTTNKQCRLNNNKNRYGRQTFKERNRKSSKGILVLDTNNYNILSQVEIRTAQEEDILRIV